MLDRAFLGESVASSSRAMASFFAESIALTLTRNNAYTASIKVER